MPVLRRDGWRLWPEAFGHPPLGESPQAGGAERDGGEGDQQAEQLLKRMAPRRSISFTPVEIRVALTKVR
jgi:hypothetical protein